MDGRLLRFALPSSAPDGRALLARVTAAYRGSRTIVFDEHLASTPSNAQVTHFEIVAPDRLSYRTRGGPAAVVIGRRRWDRETPRGHWLASDQDRLQTTQPYWRASRNVHLVAPDVLTFLDPTIPAWFRLTIAGSRLERLDMTAAAHFMVDRYIAFDGAVTVSPPPSR